MPESEILEKISPKIAKGILNVRKGKVNIDPGYDGVYGKIDVFSEEDEESKKQMVFF